jgi:hypothetical protein
MDRCAYTLRRQSHVPSVELSKKRLAHYVLVRAGIEQFSHRRRFEDPGFGTLHVYVYIVYSFSTKRTFERIR